MVHSYKTYIVRVLLILLLSWLNTTLLYSQRLHATIRTNDVSESNLTPISPLMYGDFIEYIDDGINGPNSLAAQELINRGFDMHDSKNTGLSDYWNQWPATPKDSAKCALIAGGYNKNGVFYQQIVNTTAQKFGIAQSIQLPSKIGTECYVYCRSTTYTGEVFAALVSPDGTEIYKSISLGKCSKDWTKLTGKFPILPGKFQCQFVIYLDSAGIVELDEASIISQDNFAGVRREQLDLYKALQPSSLRFLGGCFSDQPAGRWERSVGELDQRHSPNTDWMSVYQRIDFGTDEYMKFCREIGAEPQLTVGFGNGTPQDAADWVEYCNGDSTSPFGSLRAKNGHPEPYHVKYWEVGNEQYGDWEIGHTTADKYAERYIDYCKAMKKIDSSIQIMINGNMWGMEWNDTIIKIARDYIDFLSLHNGVGYDITPQHSADSIYTLLTLNPFFFDFWLQHVESSCEKSGMLPSTKIAITEWIQLYGASAKQHTVESASLLSGLWNAMIFNIMINHADIITLVNKTIFIGVVQCWNDSKGERVIFADPSYHILQQIRSQFRKNSISIAVESSMHDTEVWKNIPWLNAIATYSEDTLVYSLVNYAKESMDVDIILPHPITERDALITEICSTNFMDANTPDFPNKITPKNKRIPFTGKITLPPLSFTLLKVGIGNTPKIDSTITIKEFTLEFQPNIVNHECTILLEVPEISNVRIEIFNSIGQKVLDLPAEEFQTGKYNVFSFNSEKFPDGMYYCIAHTKQGLISKQFAVIH